MPEVILRPLALQDLRRLARGEPPRCAAAPGPEGALPPPFVAQRSLRQHAAGVPWRWCSTFLVLRRADRAIVGGCGFKDAPRDGRVEIGYGIAAACRGRGHAQQAVRALLRRAFRSGEVEQVLAHVAPDNLPSTRVVQALGFRRGALLVDEQGETLVEWVATPATREARAG